MPMPSGSSGVDPYLWLEEVEGADALAWVRERNRATHAALVEGQPRFDARRERLRAAFDAEDRIPHLRKLGERYYNFWQDEENPRGLWRRTTLEEYRKPAPDWEVVLDFDELGRAEGERWVFAGAPVLVPGYDRALVRLSRGGADAVVVREFDLVARRFVEGGFALPESKGEVAWTGPNEIFVAANFGPGTMTDSGYPRIVKLWRRGQPPGEAAIVFEGEASDVSVRAWADLAPGFETELVARSREFFNEDRFVRRDGELIPLDVPSDAGFAVHRGRLFVTPRADWETDGGTFPAGSPLAIGLDRFLAGARNERHLRSLRGLLARATLLPTAPADYDEAAILYRVCRGEGETVRKLIDCLVASIAIRTGATVLHHDSDFDVPARHGPAHAHGHGALRPWFRESRRREQEPRRGRNRWDAAAAAAGRGHLLIDLLSAYRARIVEVVATGDLAGARTTAS